MIKRKPDRGHDADPAAAAAHVIKCQSLFSKWKAKSPLMVQKWALKIFVLAALNYFAV